MIRRSVVAGLFLACGLAAIAAEPPPRYFTCPVDQLEILDGTLPYPQYDRYLIRNHAANALPGGHPKTEPFQIRLDKPGAVEVVIEAVGDPSWSRVFLAVRADADGPITGSFRFPKGEQYQTVRWRLPAKANTVRAADWFNFGRAYRLDRTYTQLVREGDRPGQAWFRNQLDEIASLKTPALAPLWQAPPGTGRVEYKPRPEPMEPRAGWVDPLIVGGPPPARRVGFDQRDFLQLVSGGRAVSENLQLKRELNVRGDGPDKAVVKVADLKGIDVQEYDWAPHIVGLRPRIDPLAASIPADQHAVFFPDVPTAVAILDELDRMGLAALNLAAARGTDDRLADRYLNQLAFPSAQLGKLLPASLVDNVAITGSDLYFDTGTDLAVLLSTPKPGLVRQLVLAGWPLVRATNRDAEDKDEVIAGMACRTLRTPDRRICCYVATIGDGIVIANSPVQIRRIADTRAQRSPALVSLPEYTFFRDRYRRGEVDEGAFAILTDAAIRRWCGPVWRIGHQRRVRTGAFLADAQATHLRAMMAAARPRRIDDPRLGPIEVGPHGAYSQVFGSRLFQTPIAEAEIDQVTTAEADAYRRWRDTYQQNWSQFFDPIAIQITTKPEKLSVDLSVLPLILQTEYRELVGLTTGARLPPGAGDPHPEALAHFVMGFDRKSETFRKTIQRYEGIVGQEFDISSWLGDWVTVYADESPLWEEFVKFDGPEDAFWAKHNWQVPVGVAIAVHDSKKHAQFIKRLRELITQFAQIEWEEVTYRGITYSGAHQKEPDGPRLWSLVLPDQWVLSMNTDVIRRTIDRHLARKDARPGAAPGWLGDSLAFTAKPKAAEYLRSWWGRSGVSSMQQTAWANIPILNEWRQLDRAIDPVAFHERWWGERLLDPAGGKYVWNADDGTMESSTHGHPGRPRGTRATLPAALAGVRGADFGITFERTGLRARVEVAR